MRNPASASFPLGLQARLEDNNQGTGSTYAALDERGYLERRWGGRSCPCG